MGIYYIGIMGLYRVHGRCRQKCMFGLGMFHSLIPYLQVYLAGDHKPKGLVRGCLSGEHTIL